MECSSSARYRQTRKKFKHNIKVKYDKKHCFFVISLRLQKNYFLCFAPVNKFTLLAGFPGVAFDKAF